MATPCAFTKAIGKGSNLFNQQITVFIIAISKRLLPRLQTLNDDIAIENAVFFLLQPMHDIYCNDFKLAC